MPKATISVQPQRFDLKSCPEGFVMLRRMTYGERLHRQDITMQMSMESDQRSKTSSLNLETAQTKVAEFEFASCIVDHNLEDDNGRRLDFRSPSDVHLLDGRIGEEIGTYIDELHDWEADLPNSGSTSTGSSTGQRPGPTNNGSSASTTTEVQQQAQ